MNRYGCFEFDGTLSLSPAPDGDWVKYSEVIAYLAPSVATEDAIVGAATEIVRMEIRGIEASQFKPCIPSSVIESTIKQYADVIRKHLGEQK